MREILFRGKSILTEEWLYGGIVHHADDYFMVDSTSNMGYLDPELVMPETVGQYTGLTDKNGVKIFEGDIVSISKEDERGVVRWEDSDAAYVIGCDDNIDLSFLENLWGIDVEVIGNIHDNPEPAEGAVMTEELKPCPFCGGKATIVYCDDEGNLHGDDYEDDPWSGLGYRIRHSHEENEDCPIARYAEDGATMGDVYIYDTREEAIEAWNRRVNNAEIH